MKRFAAGSPRVTMILALVPGGVRSASEGQLYRGLPFGA
jgi:hypothetical protein